MTSFTGYAKMSCKELIEKFEEKAKEYLYWNRCRKCQHNRKCKYM